MKLFIVITISTLCFLTRVTCAAVRVFDDHSPIHYSPAYSHFKHYPTNKNGHKALDFEEIRLKVVKEKIESCKNRLPKNAEVVIRIYPSLSQETGQIQEEKEKSDEFLEELYDSKNILDSQFILTFIRQETLPPIICSLDDDVELLKRSPGRMIQSVKARWGRATTQQKSQVAAGVGLTAATLGAIATPYPTGEVMQKRDIVTATKKHISTSVTTSNDGKKVSIREEDEDVIYIGSQGAAPMRKRGFDTFVNTAGMAGMFGGMVITPAVMAAKGAMQKSKDKSSQSHPQQRPPTMRKRSIPIDSVVSDEVQVVKRQPRPGFFRGATKLIPNAVSLVGDIKKAAHRKRSLPSSELEEKEAMIFKHLSLASELRFQRRDLPDFAPTLVKRINAAVGRMAGRAFRGLSHASNAATVFGAAGSAASSLRGALPKSESFSGHSQTRTPDPRHLIGRSLPEYFPPFEKRARGGLGKLASKLLAGINHTSNAAMVVSTAGGAAATLGAGWKSHSAANAPAPAPAPAPAAHPKRSLQEEGEPRLVKRGRKGRTARQRAKNQANNGASNPTNKPAKASPQNGQDAKLQSTKMSKGEKAMAGLSAAMGLSMIASTAGEVKGWVKGNGGADQQAPAKKRDLIEQLEEKDVYLIESDSKKPEETQSEMPQHKGIKVDSKFRSRIKYRLLEEQMNENDATLIKRSPIMGFGSKGGAGGSGRGAKALGVLEAAGSASMLGGMVTPVLEPVGKGAAALWSKAKGAFGKNKGPQKA